MRGLQSKSTSPTVKLHPIRSSGLHPSAPNRPEIALPSQPESDHIIQIVPIACQPQRDHRRFGSIQEFSSNPNQSCQFWTQSWYDSHATFRPSRIPQKRSTNQLNLPRSSDFDTAVALLLPSLSFHSTNKPQPNHGTIQPILPQSQIPKQSHRNSSTKPPGYIELDERSESNQKSQSWHQARARL